MIQNSFVLKKSNYYLCPSFMQPQKYTYQWFHVLASLLMMLMLTWLTVCTPVVYNWQLKQKAEAVAKEKTGAGENEMTGNPLSNTNEEKTETGVSLLSEYLHSAEEPHRPFSCLSIRSKCKQDAEYIAFHGELLSPPPEA
jgi:hypothetical protein